MDIQLKDKLKDDSDKIDLEIDLIEKYISEFTPYQKIAYQIAVKQLETSFCIEKSIGFIQYKKEKEKTRCEY